MTVSDAVTQRSRLATKRDTFRHRHGVDWTYPVLPLGQLDWKRRNYPELDSDLPEDRALAVQLKQKQAWFSQMLTTRSSVSSYRWELDNYAWEYEYTRSISSVKMALFSPNVSVDLDVWCTQIRGVGGFKVSL